MIAGSEVIFHKLLDSIIEAGYRIVDYDNDQLMQLSIGIVQGINIFEFIHPGLDHEEMLNERLYSIMMEIEKKYGYRELPMKLMRKFERRSMKNSRQKKEI